MTAPTGGWPRAESPFHAGEREIQERVGVRDSAEAFGRRVIRDYMPDQHRDFYQALPFIGIGHVDADGWPWASLVTGEPGFVHSPDPTTLRISGAPEPGDPLGRNLAAGAPVGLLGIEFATRRRNRMNARIRSRGSDGFVLDVDQSFGNCPQYIQAREPVFYREPGTPSGREVEHLLSLDNAARALIDRSDTFFVASAVSQPDDPSIEGVDMSHRGGRPGFVRIDGDTLTIPDYTGNAHFNTLGNFLVNPRAGLLFVDFQTGDMLMLTGRVEIIWSGPDIDAFEGAERAWRFELERAIRLPEAMPLRWEAGEVSPNSLLTGTWTEAEARLATEARREAWRTYKVVRIEDESAVIRSFNLEPEDGEPLFGFAAGQYLTLRANIPGHARPVVRTYTLSSAPTDKAYRISVKREPPSSGGTEPGTMSNFLHDEIGVGDLVEARAPRGAFTIDASENRPAVLLSGGVGITPMVSMARHVAVEGLRTRHMRPLTLIHSAQSSAQRAFFDEMSELTRATDGVIRYVSLLDRPGDTEIAGRDYHGVGRINRDVLRAALAFDDYDFYVCGPPAFMQGIYDLLRDLGVRDRRIFTEAFGPASLLRRRDVDGTAEDPGEDTAEEAVVRFGRSGAEQRWTRSDGTLLEFAEAHGFEPEFGCRNGACGSCAVGVSSGQVNYETRPIAEIPEGQAILCCARPARDSDAITLDL